MYFYLKDTSDLLLIERNKFEPCFAVENVKKSINEVIKIL